MTVVFLCKEHHLPLSVYHNKRTRKEIHNLKGYVDLRKITAKKVLKAIINKNYNSSFQ